MKARQLTGKLLLFALVALLAGTQALAQPPTKPVTAPASASYLTQKELAVVGELNLARTNPSGYAKYLEARLPMYKGNRFEEPGKITLVTKEGRKAVEEAIAFLKKQAPIGALTASKGLSLAARDHVEDTGPYGLTGHAGRDGSTMVQRINRYGRWLLTYSENIFYGNDDARKIVISLIVDDDVSSRGHCMNIFSPAFTRVGVAIGPHDGYRHMCVMDFAGGYIDK